MDWCSFKCLSLSLESFIWLELQHPCLYKDYVAELWAVAVLVAQMVVFSLVNSIRIGRTAAHLSLTEMLALFPGL